jgi:hypothetical protein
MLFETREVHKKFTVPVGHSEDEILGASLAPRGLPHSWRAPKITPGAVNTDTTLIRSRAHGMASDDSNYISSEAQIQARS